MLPYPFHLNACHGKRLNLILKKFEIFKIAFDLESNENEKAVG